MGILRIVLLSVEAIVSLLLIGVILMQQSSGQGLGTTFGGGSGDSLFGARAGNVLTKITIILASIFMLNTLGIVLISTKTQETSLVDQYAAPVAPSAQRQIPAQGGPQGGPQGGAPVAPMAPGPAPVAPSAPNVQPVVPSPLGAQPVAPVPAPIGAPPIQPVEPVAP